LGTNPRPLDPTGLGPMFLHTDPGKVDGYTKKDAGHHMLIKIDDYAQDLHILKISCATLSIALSFTYCLLVWDADTTPIWQRENGS